MTIFTHKIGQWPDPLTPPRSTTECIGWASGDWPWPAEGGWKTCNEWKTTWSHIEVEAFLDFNGPDNLGQDAIDALKTCAIVSAGSAIVAGVATDGAAAAAAAKATFIVCLKAKGVEELDKYDVAFRTSAGWT